MEQILAGVETEYGLYIEGRGASEQIEDAAEFVRGYPGDCFVGWDYRYESPRSDLRGFKLDHLAFDPEDAKFDEGKKHAPAEDIRSDRILPNGARFYNDHGHPEYATPECFSLEALAIHDKAGELVLLRAAEAYAGATGRTVKVYKNNSDFHGASYGTHESYLVPRSLGFQNLYDAVMPMLIARQILTGAGKVGAETGRSCAYQISARADFFVEPFNAETLYRRPIFNTRDEPHADPREWIRLHVISGDANMMASCTARKVGLVKIALSLALAGEAPVWKFANPVQAFQAISRDEGLEFRIELEGRGNWTTAYEVLESYFAAWERVSVMEDEASTIAESRTLLASLRAKDLQSVKHTVDWAAKRLMLESFMAEAGMDWNDPALRAYDLEYSNIHPDEGLYHALMEMGEVEAAPTDLAEYLLPGGDSRAFARGVAAQRFGGLLRRACWASVTLAHDGKEAEVRLAPNRRYSAALAEIRDVGAFIEALKL